MILMRLHDYECKGTISKAMPWPLHNFKQIFNVKRTGLNFGFVHLMEKMTGRIILLQGI
jgi:hypothetical protein